MAIEIDQYDVNEDVARYLLRVAIATTPPEVLQTLNEMDPSDLEDLFRLGERFRASGATAYYVLPFGIH